MNFVLLKIISGAKYQIFRKKLIYKKPFKLYMTILQSHKI